MWGMIPLRVMFGVIIILQGIERVQVLKASQDSLLSQLPHDWMLAIVLLFSIIEILAGICAISGFMVRIVGFTIAIETFVAIVFERIPLDFSSDLQTQMLFIGIASLMIFSGAGRHSVDHWLACRHLVRYPNKKWELYCLAETPYTKWWE